MSPLNDHFASKLVKPVAVFDAGVGSYDIAERIHYTFPKQDVIYLADRASFPYGSKEPDELFAAVSSAINYLQEQYGCTHIVLASNTPSVMVLESLKEAHPDLNITGIFPPIEKALEISKTGKVGVLGTDSMTNSPTMKAYIERVAGKKAPDIVMIASSVLINDYVETGLFVSDQESTKKYVKNFMEKRLAHHPDLDVMTLSSTHLPWLNRPDNRAYFSDVSPGITFIDPAEDLVKELTLPNDGKGILKAIATTTPELTISALEQTFRQMRIDMHINPVHFRGKANQI